MQPNILMINVSGSTFKLETVSLLSKLMSPDAEVH